MRIISIRFEAVNRRLSISLYWTLSLLSVALVSSSIGSLPDIHVPTPHLDEGRPLPSDTIIGSRSRLSRKHTLSHDENRRGDRSAAMHGNNDSGYNSTLSVLHGSDSSSSSAPPRNYSRSQAHSSPISSFGSTAVALPKQQQKSQMSNTTSSSIKNHHSLLMTPARSGRELLDNSWYWYCDTFNGPVCATCQQLPDGKDPCMVRH